MVRPLVALTIVKLLRYDIPELFDVDDLNVVELDLRGPIPTDLQVDVIVTGNHGSPELEELLARYPDARWIHAFGTGVEKFPLDAVGPDQILTCARGSSAVPISEWVMAHVLARAKGIPDVWVSEPTGNWFETPARIQGLSRTTLVIFGLGSIGREVAKRSLPFGMRVVALRRTRGPVDLEDVLEGVEVATDLHEAVADAEHLVLTAPLTAATHHIIDDSVLAAAKPGLHLVNTARGGLIDDDALRRALDSGQVSYASLDTVDPEPLPTGHWMYDHPRVRLTPHISWIPGAYAVQTRQLLDNIERFRTGRPLLGTVDIEHGY